MAYTKEQELIRLAMLQDMANLMNAGVSQEAAGAAVAQEWGGQLTPTNQVPTTPEKTATQKYVGTVVPRPEQGAGKGASSLPGAVVHTVMNR